MKWEKYRLFSFEAIKKIMEQLPGARKGLVELCSWPWTAMKSHVSKDKYQKEERVLYSFVVDLGKSCYQSWKIW